MIFFTARCLPSLIDMSWPTVGSNSCLRSLHLQRRPRTSVQPRIAPGSRQLLVPGNAPCRIRSWLSPCRVGRP